MTTSQPTPHLAGVANTDALRLAIEAAARYRTGGLVCLAHPSGWKRPADWPLPVKRRRPAGGLVVQEYRADAVLAWCNQMERPAKAPATRKDET